MPDIEIRTADLIIIILYLCGMAAFGLKLAKKNNTTEAYFVGNRSFPGWVIGLSILGTSISSITFLTIPGAAYTLDWRQLTANLTIPLVALVAIAFFIPIFRHRRLTTAYEYLDLRFNGIARAYAVASGIIFQYVRIAMVLSLVSIPVHLATGVDIKIVIIAMGVFIAFYTILGGIEAVIWTDVIQAIILWLGGIVAFVIIVIELPEGFGQIVAMGSAEDKFSLGEMRWDIGERTFHTMFLLGIFAWVGYFAGDQTVVQRYVAAKSTKDARQATALYTCTVLPTWAFFYLIGTSLFVYYKVFFNADVAGLEADQVFPYFILTKMPVVLTGVLLAGLLAAAMSTLDSTINAISTVLTIDVFKPYIAKNKSDRFYLIFAKLIGVFTTVIMIVGAIRLSEMPKESINDINWIVASLLSGGMVGIYMAGIFTTRIDSKSMVIALVFAFLTNLYLGLGMRDYVDSFGIHDYWIGPLVNAIFLVIAYGVSVARGYQPDLEKLRNLTVWTLDRKSENSS